MVVYRTGFFIKAHLFSKTINWNPAKMSFQETFDINYYYHYCAFIDWRQKRSFTWFIQIEGIKFSQKRGKIIYLYKTVNINFFIIFKISSKFQELPCSKVKWNLFGEIYFPSPSRTVFWDTSLDGIHLKKDSMPYFSVSMPCFVAWILCLELRIYYRGYYEIKNKCRMDNR